MEIAISVNLEYQIGDRIRTLACDSAKTHINAWQCKIVCRFGPFIKKTDARILKLRGAPIIVTWVDQPKTLNNSSILSAARSSTGEQVHEHTMKYGYNTDCGGRTVTVDQRWARRPIMRLTNLDDEIRSWFTD